MQLSFVKVTFGTKSAFTDANGYYEIVEPDYISGQIKAELSGYNTQVKDITAPTTGELTVDFYLTPYIPVPPPLPEETAKFWTDKGYTLSEADKIAAWVKANKMTPTDDKIAEIIGKTWLIDAIKTALETAAKYIGFVPHASINILFEELLKLPNADDLLTTLGMYGFDKLVKEAPEFEVLRKSPRGSVSIAVIIGIVSLILSIGTVVGWLRKEAPEPTGMAVWAAIEIEDWEAARKANEQYKIFIDKLNWWVPTVVSWFNPFLAWMIAINTKSQIAQYETYKKLIDGKLAVKTGTLKITATPADAKIQVEGQYPATGIFSQVLNVGSYKVSVSAFGLVPQDFTAVVEENKMTEFNIILTKTPVIEIPEEVETYVRDIFDGDTIEVDTAEGKLPLYGTTTHARVRILGINTPEKSPKGEILCTGIEIYEVEPKYTDLARDVLLPLNDKLVTLYIDPAHQTDGYGRVLAKVVYAGEDIGLKQIQRGYACWYHREDNKYEDAKLYEAETLKAKEAGIGMWAVIIPPVEKQMLFTIKSTPINCQVWIDGVYTHHLTPTDEVEQKDVISLWTEGKHTLKLLKSGMEKEGEIELVAGQRLEINWDLTALPPPVVPPEIPPEVPPEIPPEVPPVIPPEPEEKDKLIVELRKTIESLNVTIKALNNRIAELTGAVTPPPIIGKKITREELWSEIKKFYVGRMYMSKKELEAVEKMYDLTDVKDFVDLLWTYYVDRMYLSKREMIALGTIYKLDISGLE